MTKQNKEQNNNKTKKNYVPFIVKPFYVTEKRILKPIANTLEKLAFFSILERLWSITIIIAILSYTSGGQERRNNDVFQAWNTITGAHGQSGSGGRIEALEFLNSRPWRFPWIGWTKRSWFWDKEQKQCQYKKLIGLRWQRQPLVGLSAEKAYLKNIHLCGANLRSANLKRANLINAKLQGAEIEGADLRKAKLINSNLKKANFSRGNLKNTKFQYIDLQNARLVRTNLTGANLAGANLAEANLFDANLAGVNLVGANLAGANLTEANLDGANLAGANLTEANFDGTNFPQADRQKIKSPNYNGFIRIKPENQIINNTNKCIDVSGAPGLKNNSNIILWNCEFSGIHDNNNTATDQKWIMTEKGFIMNQLSGKCMDLKATPRIKKGYNLILFDCKFPGVNSSNNDLPTTQEWKMTNDGLIRNQSSKKCIGIEHLKRWEKGANLRLKACQNVKLEWKWFTTS